MPKVSILIPAYNVEKYLSQCLDSVLYQTYRNLQIVVIDDGSKDGTWDVMQDYAAKDDRIEIYHQENQGVAETRNNLLSRSKGEWILFVDADDWIERQMLEYMVSCVTRNDVEIVVCGHVINNEVVSSVFSEETYDHEKLVLEFLKHLSLRGQLWNKLLKAEIARTIKFVDGIGYGEDALFCWTLFQRLDKAIFSTRELYHYRLNKSSISATLFSPVKMSAHFVWDYICQEVSQKNPLLKDIAKARWCMEDVLLLRSAAHAKYPKTGDIRLLQKSIRNNYKYLAYSDFIPLKWKMYAFWVKRLYVFAII